MGRIMQPARVPSGDQPSIQSIQALAGQAIVKGSVVFADANGLLNLAGADPASILGVALEAINSKPGFNAANSPVAINFPSTSEVSIAFANRDTIFSARGENPAGTIRTPTQADIGDAVGIAVTAGEWWLDFSDVVNTRVRVVDVDIDNKIYFFKFLEANLQVP